MNRIEKFLRNEVLRTIILCLKYKNIRGYKNIYFKIYGFIEYPKLPLSHFCKPAVKAYYGHKLFRNSILMGISERCGKYFFVTDVGCGYHYNGQHIVYSINYEFAEVWKNFSISPKLNVKILKLYNQKFSIYYIVHFCNGDYVLDLPKLLINYLVLNFK